jgi:hypothetical protein
MMQANSKDRNRPSLLKGYMQLQLLMANFITAWTSCTDDLAAEAAAAEKLLAIQQLQETGEVLASQQQYKAINIHFNKP